MNITQQIWGVSREGDQIVRFTLSAANGIEVQLISYGASLTSVRLPDRKGRVDEVTLGFESLEGYLNPHPYFGATLGRVANRIARGRFVLDGTSYSLFCNDGNNHLHGGRKGFDRARWNSSAFLRDVMGGVHFTYESPGGEEGYPGTLDGGVTYTLDDSGTLEIIFDARTDAPTVVNLSNHAYWNLKGDGRGDIKEHEVTLFADRYLPVDAELIPTGELRPVQGTPYDFRKPRPIGRDLSLVGGGYDVCYVLGDQVDGLRPVARVKEPSTGRGLEMWTTQPGVQLYSGHMLGPITGRGGEYRAYGALALETEGFPDAVNQSGFPSVVLRPGQRSRERTRIRFFAE